MSGVGVFLFRKLVQKDQAKEGEQFKMIQADGETGGSWVVQNDPSQKFKKMPKMDYLNFFQKFSSALRVASTEEG